MFAIKVWAVQLRKIFVCLCLHTQAKQQKSPFASLLPPVPPGTLVHDLKWNPGQASMLAACLSDGGMQVVEVADGVKVLAELPASSGITCSAWDIAGEMMSLLFSLFIYYSLALMNALWPSSTFSPVCWSPKGKQVAAGKMDGTVIQYTPVSNSSIQQKHLLHEIKAFDDRQDKRSTLSVQKALEKKKVIPCPHFYTSEEPVKGKCLFISWWDTYFVGPYT